MGTTKRRALRGHTHDAWPCCGEPPDSEYGRPKNGICDECARLITIGRAALARQAAAGHGRYRWARVVHLWPGYLGPYQFRNRESRRNLEEAVFDLVNLLSENVEEHGWDSGTPPMLECREGASHIDERVLVSADPEVRKRLNAVDRRIREALEDVYHEGKKRGQGILLQLAGGELSLQDFEKRTVGE